LRSNLNNNPMARAVKSSRPIKPKRPAEHFGEVFSRLGPWAIKCPAAGNSTAAPVAVKRAILHLPVQAKKSAGAPAKNNLTGYEYNSIGHFDSPVDWGAASVAL
jgi:hypothetical protein